MLEGLHAAVYESCDQAHNERGLLRELAAHTGRAVSWQEVSPIVAELCEQKIMLALDGYYFSLALNAGLRPMNISLYPGGRLRTLAEARAAEMMRDAQDEVNSKPGTVHDWH